MEILGWEDGPPLPEPCVPVGSNEHREEEEEETSHQRDGKREGLGVAGMARDRGDSYCRLLKKLL